MFFSSFFRAFQPAILAKLHISRQRYCFFHTYASARHIFLIKSHNLPLFSSPNPLSSPFVCHLLAPYLHWNLIGTSSESHRNLIGTSSESHRMISVSSSNYQRYLNSSLFIILPLRSTASRLACPDSPTPLTYTRVFHKELLCPLSSGVPENARGVLGCLTNVIQVYPASKH